ncbi:Uncharacterised protein [Mycobacterium tuberculosis]|uniref:Uncharacterized protein n=1 Tax=Mycobacterium tuberculosis TaxID=1773 RepID=A0A916PC90_MYCTX|nr:Uncharacterised protein [Mycobacterium tuberculosis]COZ15564.1 Uncharacterised protein [Mycobacterium tuberculosis]
MRGDHGKQIERFGRAVTEVHRPCGLIDAS